MEQKELERNDKEISLDDILNSVPEEAENEDAASDEADTEVSDDAPVADAESEADVKSEQAEDDVREYIPGEHTVYTNEHEEYEEDDDYDEYEEDDDYEEERPRKKKRKKRGHGHIIFGIFFSVFIISVSILAAAFILKCAKEFLAIDKSDIEIVIDIPFGSTTSDIADMLYNEGIVSDPRLFVLFSRFKKADGTFTAGTHKISANMDYNVLIETLQEEIESQRETANIVFPEGITLYEAAKKLEDKNICNADEFIKVFNAGGLGFDFEEKVKNNSLKFYKMEGYMFPDTYQFYVEEDPRIVAKKIYRNFDARITPDLYGRMDDLGMELEEVLTLASIVQAEASNTKDMKRVASVFYNRLNNPDEYPLLQSDPTTNYVEYVIMPNIEFKSEAMFKAYDTYRGAGLPPGPICNPGLDAINAVLYPAETDYYYFCSNLSTGEFYFAKTIEEHEQNLLEAGLNAEDGGKYDFEE